MRMNVGSERKRRRRVARRRVGEGCVRWDRMVSMIKSGREGLKRGNTSYRDWRVGSINEMSEIGRE